MQLTARLRYDSLKYPLPPVGKEGKEAKKVGRAWPEACTWKASVCLGVASRFCQGITVAIMALTARTPLSPFSAPPSHTGHEAGRGGSQECATTGGAATGKIPFIRAWVLMHACLSKTIFNYSSIAQPDSASRMVKGHASQCLT